MKTALGLLAVAIVACGGSTSSDPSAGGAAGSPTSGGSGGAGGTGASGGSAATGGGTSCPASVPSSFSCDPQVQGCEYTIDCQSGSHAFVFSCETSGFGWSLEQQSCEPGKPYDSCPGTALYCTPDYGWHSTVGSDTPAPCPKVLPSVGQVCIGDSFGGYTSPCGYACPNGGWQILKCVYDAPANSTTWQVETPCP